MYIYNNNGGFAIAEGSRNFGGYQKSFVNSLRAYAHPASRPSSVVRGRRYSHSGMNYHINTNVASMNTAKNDFVITKT